MNTLIDKTLLRKTRDNLRASADYQAKLATNIDRYLGELEQETSRLTPSGRASIARKIAASWHECPIRCGTKHRNNHPHMTLTLKKRLHQIIPDETVVAA